jgi:T-complex protein 1 subunit delta
MTQTVASLPTGVSGIGGKKEGNKQGAFKELDKAATIRSSNILAAKAVADAVRTSLGPKGMDKMIQV